MEHGYAEVKAISVNLRPLVTLASLDWKGDTSHGEERLLHLRAEGTGALMEIEAYRCPDCKVVAFSCEKRKEFQEGTKSENYEYSDVEKYLR
jgi:hypothetical protein